MPVLRFIIPPLLLLLFAAGEAVAQEVPTAAERTFNLQQAVDYAYGNSNAVRNARVDILDAAENVREQLAGGLPQINGTLDFQHFLKVPVLPLPEAFAMGDPNAPTSIAFQLKNNFTAGIAASSQVFNGSFFVALKAARESETFYNLQLEETQRQVRNQVTQSYFPVLLLSTNLTILDRNIDNLERLLVETRAQYEAGFIEQLDVDRLVLSLRNLRNNRANVLVQRDNALRNLKFALNYPEEETLNVSDDLNELELEIEQTALAGEIPYGARSEVRLLDQTLKLQDLNLELQRAAYLPSVSAVLSGQYQYQGDNLSDGFWAPTVVAGLTANIPIYEFGGRSARVQRAKLAKEKIVNQRDDVVRGIELEVRNARSTFVTAKEVLDQSRENQDLARRIYETTQIKYREGVGSSIEVVQAEQQLYEAQANYLTALYDTLVAKENLYLALGQ